MSKLLVVLIACAMFCAMAVQCIGGPSVENIGENAKIDWTNLVYIVEGNGAMPSPQEEPNRARAKLKAKDYAKMDALANLMMAIEGTTISYESTGKDYMADTTIRQKIEGFVKNAQITKERVEKVEGSSIVVVEMRAPMFGYRSPGQLFVKETPKQPEPEKAVATPTTPEKPIQAVVETNVKVVLKPDKAIKVTTTTTITASEPSNPYTGCIIDAMGYKLDRCMSPKIRKVDGSEVWGTVKVDADTVLDRGIVSYATSLSEAMKNPRAGSHPLIIKAAGRAGGRFFSDPCIPDEAAITLVTENQKAGFLDKFNVVFVKDAVLQ